MDEEDISSAAPFKRWKLGVCHIPEGRAVFPGAHRPGEPRHLAGRAPPSNGSLEKATAGVPGARPADGPAGGDAVGGEQQMLALARA